MLLLMHQPILDINGLDYNHIGKRFSLLVIFPNSYCVKYSGNPIEITI
jgi:hypothetical protein